VWGVTRCPCWHPAPPDAGAGAAATTRSPHSHVGEVGQLLEGQVVDVGDLQPFQAPAKGNQRGGDCGRPRAGFGAATGRAVGLGTLWDSQGPKLGQALKLAGEELSQGVVRNIPAKRQAFGGFSAWKLPE